MEHHQILRRGLGALLSLLLCLTLLPGAALAAETDYGFSINGTQVTSDNIQTPEELGVTATEAGKDFSISYDTTTKTLTLKNVTITGISDYPNGKTVLDCSNAVSSIKLEGQNIIQCTRIRSNRITYKDVFAGIRTVSALTITGGGRSDGLEITMPEYPLGDSISMYGIYTTGLSLTIQDCTLNVICAGETKAANSVTNAIYAMNNSSDPANGDITIANADVTAVIGKNPENDTITAIRGGSAIYAENSTLRITDSTVTAGTARISAAA